MEKKCDNCISDNIGCDVIKKMRSDIAKLRRINWKSLLFGLLIGGFIALAIVVVWSNFCSRVKENNTPVTVQLAVKEIKDLAKTDKDAIDKVLQSTAEKAFYQGRKEAQNEFDKNFTTLLTILTIFGIAWPVVIAILQSMKFSQDQQKIEALIKENQKISQQAIKMHDTIKQLNYRSLVQAGQNNLKFASILGFEFQRKTAYFSGARSPFLLDPTKDKQKEFAYCLLIEAMHCYAEAEKMIPSIMDDTESPFTYLYLCSTYLENLVFNYRNNQVLFDDNVSALAKVMEQVKKLDKSNMNYNITIENLERVWKLLQQDLKQDGVKENKERDNIS